MFTLQKSIFIIMVFFSVLLAACNMPVASPPTQQGPEALYTAAAQTVAVQLTQAAAGTQPVIVTVTLLPGGQPTNTQAPAEATNTISAPTALPAATNTPVPPTATSIPIPCDRGSFVSDVTYPDDTEVAAGATFVKTWRLRNTGSCTWNSSYSLVFDSGDSLGGPASTQLTTGSVAPGDTVDVSVTLKAPDSPKDYRGNWKLRNGAGVVFGIGADAKSPFFVKVKVINPVTPTPTVVVLYNFADKAPSAEWRNGSTGLPWGDPGEDDPGVAAHVNNVRLENGRTYNRALATYPERIENGIIKGIFPSYAVNDNDHFKALLGFRSDCGSGRVKFQLNYREDGTETPYKEWRKSCDGSLLVVDVDLSTLKGKTVQFILLVDADGAFNDDKAVWVDPIIVK